MAKTRETRPDDWYDSDVLVGLDGMTVARWKAAQTERLWDAAVVVRHVCGMLGRVPSDRRADDKRMANRVLGVLTNAIWHWQLAEAGGSALQENAPEKIWKNDLPYPTPEQRRNAAALSWETWLPTWVESLERELRVGVTVALVAGDSKSAWLVLNRVGHELSGAKKLCAEVLETS